MTDAKKFPFKLNEFIEEDVPVKKMKFDPDTGRIFSSLELEKRKVMFLDVPKDKLRCKRGQHIFKCVDSHRYIFTCTNPGCHYSRQVYPTTYEFKDGKLIHRVTGQVI